MDVLLKPADALGFPFYLLCDLSYITFWKIKTVERVRGCAAATRVGVEREGKLAAERKYNNKGRPMTMHVYLISFFSLILSSLKRGTNI